LNHENLKLFYAFSCITLGLIILLPALSSVITFPEGETFSELWLLGSNNQIESGALNVSEARPFTVHLGVANHMGAAEYYRVYAKFRQQNEPLPNKTGELPSPLEPVFDCHLFLSNNEIWNGNFTFSLEEISFQENFAHVSKLSINDNEVNVNKIVAWDEESKGFYCQLFFELWIYNSTASGFQFHNHYVSLWLRIMNA